MKTYLPVFPGFYGTIFEGDYGQEDSILEEINERRAEEGHLLKIIDTANIEFDYRNFHKSIVQACCEAVEFELSKILDTEVSIKNEGLRSPGYYNFSNDSVDIDISIKDKEVITNYLLNSDSSTRFNELAKYIKDNYTSYDGFASGYSNNIMDWLEETKNFGDFSCNEHYLGSLLNFILENKGFNHESLYYACEDNIDLLEAIEFDNLYKMSDVDLMVDLDISEDSILEHHFNYTEFYPSLDRPLVFGDKEQIQSLKEQAEIRTDIDKLLKQYKERTK